jgi:2-oxoglutarate ferredoxin oxidoreductase subunit beta
MSLTAKQWRSAVKPIWCPGCGHYGVLNAITKALAASEREPETCTVVSGIGCSSRLPAYVRSYGFHGVHGRALPLATGLKIARPELTVLAVGGDGDGFSIGGNHFLHACRRNVDLVYVVMDNEVYGMTKGQASPTSPEAWTGSKLTPRGTEMRPFVPCALALSSGAGFVARGHAGDPNGLARLIHEALRYEGFAFVHVLSQCITFVPDQQGWKERVHELEAEPAGTVAEAAARVHADDGFGKGVFLSQPRPVWPPSRPPEPTDPYAELLP